MTEAYDGRQVVGMDLHRRRSADSADAAPGRGRRCRTGNGSNS
jgi:hypothetical protein